MLLIWMIAVFLALPQLTEGVEETHAIYLSVCEIDHREEGNSANLNIKVFETDIRDAFMNLFSDQPDFSKTNATEEYAENTLKYFTKYLRIRVNDNPVDIKFSSLEQNGDSVWFYFTLKCSENWNSVEVTADYLMELFPGQSNVVSIYHGEDKQFLRLTREKKSGRVSFQN